MKNIKHWGKRKAENRYESAKLYRDQIEEIHAGDVEFLAKAKALPKSIGRDRLIEFAEKRIAETELYVEQAIAATAAAHPDNVVPDLEGAPGRLPNGDGWGVWVQGWDFNPGDTVKVSTKRGKTWLSEILDIVRLTYTEDNEPLALCTAEKLK